MNVDDERGAGAVVVLALIAALGLATLVALSLAGAVAARHRAMSAADLGALAGAGAAVRGGDPCGESARIVRANGARLRRCSARRAIVTVTVDLSWRPGWGLPLPAMQVLAVSRAGPVEADRSRSGLRGASP